MRFALSLLVAASAVLGGCTTTYVIEKQQAPAPPVDEEPTAAASSDTAPADHAADIAAFETSVDALLAATKGKTPGASVAIVKRGQIAFARGYGLADVASNRPMRADTILEVASISKTLTALAAMVLVDNHYLDLDADIQDVIGLPLRNPSHPTTPITLRMLLTHTSSIVNYDAKLEQMIDEHMVDDADSPYPLHDLVAETFVPGQRYYDAAHFRADAPGTAYEYCNVCPSITAYAIEKVAGEALDAFTRDVVVKALGLGSTTWRYADTDKSRLATAYTMMLGPTLTAMPAMVGYPYYPAVNLHTTASDLARVLIELTSGHRLLGASAAKAMLTVQYPKVAPQQGLAFMNESTSKEPIFGHGGANGGEADDYQVRLSDGTGVVVLTNGDFEQVAEPTHLEIENELWKLAEKL